MKQIRKHILTLVLPLTVIIFGTITKWRYVDFEDGPDDFFYGFPLPFFCNAWYTSLALQIFVLEFIFDFLTYFIFCLTIVTLVDKFYRPIVVRKYLKIILYGLATFTLLLYGLIFSNPDNIFKLKRDFKYKEIRNGYKSIWQQDKK